MYDFKNPTIGSEAFHEAGYDAFITGLSFLRMSKSMTEQNLLKYKNNVNICWTDFNVNFEDVDIYREKVYIYIYL